MTPEPTQDAAFSAGYERGHNAGTWLTIDSPEHAQTIIDGFDAGDPEVMDLQPAPLSGEWAGESIPELSAEYGIDLEDDEIADRFEEGFSDGFWNEVIRAAKYQTDSPDVFADLETSHRARIQSGF